MSNVTFITGNQDKADFLAKFLGVSIPHTKLDLEEIQSLDLQEVAGYKARQAYATIKSPVLVEDAGLVIKSMGRLPGPFIKWFHHELGLDGVCRLVDGLPSREATHMVCFVYFDGKDMKSFEGKVDGTIATKPAGNNGFGFDSIFVHVGLNKTVAEMNDKQMQQHSVRTVSIYPQIKEFLSSIDKT